MEKSIKCREIYRATEGEKAEERKKCLETYGLHPVLRFEPFWAYPYILTWYVKEEDQKTKKYFSIDFVNNDFGIRILAKSEEEARKIAENPLNWKDGKARIIACIKEEKII